MDASYNEHIVFDGYYAQLNDKIIADKRYQNV